MRRIAITLLVTITAGGMLTAMAASKHIGVAMGKGDIRVDKTFLQGNATLFSGATVETGDAISSVVLYNGAEYQLGPQSAARVYEDRLVLDRGTAELRHGAQNQLSLGTVNVRPGEQNGLLRVSRTTDGTAQIAAVRGDASVYSSSGQLLASVPSGMGLAFDPQAANAAPPLKLHATVTARDGRYYLTDCQTGESMEVRGEDIAKWVGKSVDVSGSVDPSPTGQVYRAVWVGASDKACRVPPAQANNSSVPNAKAAKGSIFTSKTTWFIVGGAAATAATAGFVSSGSDPVSR